MNILQKLRYRKIKFSGWQMPLREWRRESNSEVPDGTEYLGSFGVMYKGKITGDYFDVYITKEKGYVEAIIGGNWRQEQLESKRRENVIHDGNKRENVIHDGNM